MHHGKNSGDAKKHKLGKQNINWMQIRGKFINFAEIGRKYINFVKIGGKCNMHHRLRGMDVPGYEEHNEWICSPWVFVRYGKVVHDILQTGSFLSGCVLGHVALTPENGYYNHPFAIDLLAPRSSWHLMERGQSILTVTIAHNRKHMHNF